MSFTLWAILLYSTSVYVYHSFIVHTFLEMHGVIFCVLVGATLAMHLKVMFTNPGAVPSDAEPPKTKKRNPSLTGDPKMEVICGRCDAFRPPRAHHCMTCGRCIVRMDHHCAWVNNCIGARNQKHFLLFLLYLHITSLYSLIFMTYHLLVCRHAYCNLWSDLSWWLLWSVFVLSFFSVMFTFFMLLSQVHAMATGLGAVDRMMSKHFAKYNSQKALDQMLVQPLGVKDICGKERCFFWACPTSVTFPNEQQALGYISLSEQLRMERGHPTPKGAAGSSKKNDDDPGV